MGYLLLVSPYIPSKHALLINVFLVPLLLGVLGGWMMKPPFYSKFILLALLPVFHLIYFGDDPGKKGLENVVFYAELTSVWFGIVAFYFIRWFVQKYF